LQASYRVRWCVSNAEQVQEKEVRDLLVGADACLSGWGSPRLTADLLDLAFRRRAFARAGAAGGPGARRVS
jgi:hypothetical protein